MAENAIIEQSTNFFKKLSLSQKLILGAVFVGMVAGLIWVVSVSNEAEKGVLYSSLEEADAATIVDRLREKNIEYDLKDGGKTIVMEKDLIYETRIELAAEGLPKTSLVGYEIFDKTNLGMSEFVQQLNYRRALEGELARTINSMDEVNKSRVHIVIPEKQLFEKDQKVPTASITLSLNSGRSISRGSVEGIQNLIAGSIEGMDPDNVTVIDQRGKTLSEKKDDISTVAGLTSKQLEQQRNVESHMSSKVQSLLDGVIGPGNSEVRVNAELDFSQLEKTITAYDPETQVERSTQTIEDFDEAVDSVNNSYINFPRDTQITTNPYVNKKSRTKTNTITNYEISQTIEKIVEGTGNINRLTVAAIINGKTEIIDKDGEKSLKYLPREEEEMNNIRTIIKNAVGYDPSRNDQISVINVPFDTSLQEEELNQNLNVPWWKNEDIKKLLILAIVIIITVFVMYRLLRSKQIQDKFRDALQIPGTMGDQQHVGDLEGIRLDDELMMLPAELPEQFLMLGDKDEFNLDAPMFGDDLEAMGKDQLAANAKARLDETPALTEGALMKIELKNKVEQYLDTETDEAVRLIRIMIATDPGDNMFRF